jgi:hypothetical protein
LGLPIKEDLALLVTAFSQSLASNDGFRQIEGITLATRGVFEKLPQGKLHL